MLLETRWNLIFGCVLFCGFFEKIHCATGQPNVVFIVADDLGWNDVGFHGSNQIPTPNIDALAYNGIILNSHYSQSFGTPSRAALLTGKYPMKLGLQGPSITPAEGRSLPEGKIMSEYFKDMGYATHLVGKWHLGHSRWNDTPTFRGFDHFFGFYNGFTSYYDYVSNWKINDKEYSGFDLRRDTVPSWNDAGKYATDLFAEHAVDVIQKHNVNTPLFMMIAHLAVHVGNEGKWLEAPQETVNKFKHIRDPNRRTYAAMVSKLDDSIGAVFEALEAKNMLQNTIVVFISDNGAPTVGPHHNWGSNYPLRGIKDTLFEGGVRTVACIWSPLLVQSSRVSTDLIHITDWLPTLFTAVGGDLSVLDPDLDGIDQWSSLVYDLPSARNDIPLNIDEKTRNAALRFSYWKLIVGTSGNGSYNGYFGAPLNENIEEQQYNTSAINDSPVGRIAKKINYNPLSETDFDGLRRVATLKCLDAKAKRNPCDPASGAVCLYNIPNDPCEENDLAKFFPSVVRRIKRTLVDYRQGLVPQIETSIDIENADPKLFQFAWNPWRDCSDAACTS
ncbi:arylsulfatase B [Tribolium castaneum]|uniref:Arylsulfatase B-like Protein n=1 Tax=Tribolium castaneum TaxID=7070 RepID=D2A3E0_TRICA|nr:PREDICTED: arylsulfatase B [Tribolium castaneum]EFA02301.1 Arylsulfatase B-like Protein [Tribolium castaneum]|eukprot:XP_008191923.1 PREDICTED: arylsulfatase B [Tribolium castaneum]